MQWKTLAKSVGRAFGSALLLVACGPEAAQETQASQSDSRVHAMAPPTSCDPDIDIGWCRVPTGSVRCADGFNMYAYSTPDGWCIRYDACKSHGGPYVCGL